VDRAEAAGFAGICVTVDSPVVGRRDSSLEDGFTWSVPPEGTVNLRDLGIDYRYRPGLDWSDFEWLVARTDLPVVIKGVMSPEDAIRAVEAGAAGIVVSNHGGRMVDHGLSTIEALAEIVESVGQGVDVAIDGGFTRGAEVCKALALGARAVGIGRLQCWGLAIGGADGVSRVLSILRAEIEATMANIGCPTLADIGPGHVRWSFPAPPV
jgi:4-hydroxymandelate oxidase